MGSIENLGHNKAAEKINELAEKARICLFTTKLNQLPLSTRPMSVLKVDSEGVLWFFSSKSSDQNLHLKTDDKVQLFFLNSGDSEFMTLFGKASVTEDKQKIEELWTPVAHVWFKDGKDDADLSIIKFVPEDGYYWDTKNGKIIQMFKIAIGTVTGKPLDDGLEGKIRL
ncbi:MAG: pyridoxamine 5'-phosphate oxidase family protein [Bacteroidia bacterium]